MDKRSVYRTLFILVLACIYALLFVGQLCCLGYAQSEQTRTGTLTFSWSKAIQQSRSFSVLGASASVSLQVDMSLTMPVRVSATSNATTARAGTNTSVEVYLVGSSAQVSVSAFASASTGGTSKSASQSWSQSFPTPLGSPSEVVFPKFSVPAIDALIGQVTVDLTPKISFKGSVTSIVAAEGPCTIDTEALQWTTSGSQEVVHVALNEQSNAEIELDSPVFTITQMEVGAQIGATVKTPLGSRSVDLGYLGLPLPTAIPVNGNPSSLTIAKYVPPTPPISVISVLTPSLDQSTYRYGVNQSVSFSARDSSTGSGTITDYAWEFGDNSSNAKSEIAAHTYSAVGTYTVRLALLNSDGLSGDTTKTIYVTEQQPPLGRIAIPATSLYWALIGVGSTLGVGTIAGITMKRRRRTPSKSAGPTVTTPGLASRGARPLVSYDYSTGAFCPIDNHPFDGSTKVLKCPYCGAIFHESCLVSILELKPNCPKCGCSLYP